MFNYYLWNIILLKKKLFIYNFLKIILIIYIPKIFIKKI